jgi:hypothetical protein
MSNQHLSTKAGQLQVLIARMSATEVADAIDKALTATPQLADVGTMEYKSPVLEAMKIRSPAAFERGLQWAILEFGDHDVALYRFLPLPKAKYGFIREEKPIFRLPGTVQTAVIASKLVDAFDDPAWPLKKSR